MDPQQLYMAITATVAILGAGGGFAVLMWRIGRWQATQEEQLRGIHERLDRMNGNIDEAHKRIDTHLEGHTD